MSRISGVRRQTEIYLNGLAGKRPKVPTASGRLERAARKKLSREAFAYVAGGAGSEGTVRENRAAFERWRVLPRMLRDVSERDTSVELFGRRLPAPLLLAPVGVLEMAHKEADVVVARAAAKEGVPFIFSNQASRPMEECVGVMGGAPRWFQLYWSTSDELVESFVRRAERSGCDAIVVTLDTTMLGWRTRDLDLAYLPFLRGKGIAQYTSDPVFTQSLSEPEEPAGETKINFSTLKALVEMARNYPGSSLKNLVSGEPLAAVRKFISTYSRPSLTWEDLAFLRQRTQLPIVLKGILHPEDAGKAVEHGMDGVIVSNHGGRQVDGAIAAFDALPEVVKAVDGHLPVLFDSGIRGGADSNSTAQASRGSASGEVSQSEQVFRKMCSIIANMKLRYRYRFYPTPEQRENLSRTFGCVRFTYNRMLAVKSEAFRERAERISYPETDKRLTTLKQESETAFLREVSSVPLKQGLRHLDKAYTAFFRGTSKFPRFKSRKHRQSATYTKQGFSSRGFGTPVVKLARQSEPLNIVWSRPLPSEPSSLTVVMEPDGRYYVSFVVEVEAEHFERTNRSVGIDLGIKDVIATSDGWKSGNPKHLRKSLDRLALEQRRLSRKVKGSGKYHKQRRRVARVHGRIRDQRRDFLHQLTTRLVQRHDVIYCESLAVKNMVKNHSLALSISDAGWGTLVAMLRYKCELYGKTLVEVDRWLPSTKTCSSCGYVLESLPLNIRVWVCLACDAEHDRDTNAAANIEAVGTTVLARGGDVRPKLASVSGALACEAGIPPL